MSLFENIDKLISEHGSATILRERLLLASDKYSTLENQVSDLKSENQRLQLDLEKASSEIQRLQKLVEKKHGKLSDEEEKILKVYAHVHKWMAISEISHRLGLSAMNAEYYINKLVEGEYLKSPMVIDGDEETSYHIDQKGREYIIQHNLS